TSSMRPVTVFRNRTVASGIDELLAVQRYPTIDVLRADAVPAAVPAPRTALICAARDARTAAAVRVAAVIGPVGTCLAAARAAAGTGGCACAMSDIGSAMASDNDATMCFLNIMSLIVI